MQILKILFAKVNSKIKYANRAFGEYNGDLNDLSTPGIYDRLIAPNNLNSPGFYGYLIIFDYRTTGNLTQVVFGYNVTKIAIRFKFDNVWNAWKIFE